MANQKAKQEEKNCSQTGRHESSLLGLPELVLECILERLDPAGLLNMSWTCRLLRSKCRSDHLWEMHLRRKWGEVIGGAAHRQWQGQVGNSGWRGKQRGWGGLSFLLGLRLPWLTGCESGGEKSRKFDALPDDSVMCWFLALESGRFWFPAQIYNREYGNVCFMLSCYDAEISYDRRTNTFTAKYLPHGRRLCSMESGITWDRIRPPAIDMPPHDLHSSDLNDLRPGDHIEIQWRRYREFPYGWWYGIVGHSESCSGNENFCHCDASDNVVLEFRQYSAGLRWRRAIISRRNHREEGNDADGFYGGIRKLCTLKEISMWQRLWPSEPLQ